MCIISVAPGIKIDLLSETNLIISPPLSLRLLISKFLLSAHL